MNGYVLREICTQVGTNDKDKISNDQQIRCPLHCCHVGCMKCLRNTTTTQLQKYFPRFKFFKQYTCLNQSKLSCSNALSSQAFTHSTLRQLGAG